MLFDVTSFTWNEEAKPIVGSYLSRVPWVVWGTDKKYYNIYPLKIEELYAKNATFKTIIKRNANSILGEGIYFEKDSLGNTEVIDFAGRQFTAEGYLKFIGLDNFVLTKLAYDISLWNGCALQVVTNKEGTSPLRVRHTHFSKIRIERPTDPDSDQPIAYYVSPDWSFVNYNGNPKPGYQNYKPIRIPKLGVGEEIGVRMIYNYEYCPISEYYPMPDAESCYKALKLTIDIIDYQEAYIENGMQGSSIIYIPYVPVDTAPGESLSQKDKAEIERIKKQIREELTGKQNAGRATIITFNPKATDNAGNPIGVPRIESPINERNDLKFIEIQKEANQSFLTGLNIISPELFGIPSSGGFSSQSEMLLTANQLHYSQIVVPKQKLLLDTITELLSMVGFKSKPMIKNNLPVMNLITVQAVHEGIFTHDEYREQYGYEPKPKP